MLNIFPSDYGRSYCSILQKRYQNINIFQFSLSHQSNVNKCQILKELRCLLNPDQFKILSLLIDNSAVLSTLQI